MIGHHRQPQQIACVERFKRTARYDKLALELFDSIDELQGQAMRWM
jgi:putative transposase